jgi:hypothetical protein
MKNIIYLLLIVTIGCANANYIRITGTEKIGSLVLEPENSGAKCEAKSFPQWNILFNTVPLQSPAMDEMFPEADKTYRIYEKWTWTDILLSIPIAYLTTITKRSLVIETCETSKVALTQEELSKKVEEELTKRDEENAKNVEETVKDNKGKSKIPSKIILKSGIVIEGVVTYPKGNVDYVEVGVKEMRPITVNKKVFVKDIRTIKQ